MFDILLRGGLIVDGTGSEGYRGDLGIVGDRIVAMGELGPAEARSILEVDGLVIAPGFIDIHSHTDEMVLVNPTCESKVTQGVTTEVSGNCGYSAGPHGGKSDWQGYVREMSEYGIEPTWRSLGEFLDHLDSAPMTINFATYVGHGMIRAAVVGYDDRSPSASELDVMCALVRRSISEGALGLSTGLIYPPGCYSGTDELIALCRAAAEFGGIYATHMRSEGENLLPAVEEAILIGREAGVGVQISHHKASGRKSWGKVNESLAMIDAARASGMDVWADQYPYVATSTSLGALLPDWAHDGGSALLLSRLRDPSTRERLRSELIEATDNGWIGDTGGWETVVIGFLRHPDHADYEGKSISEISCRLGVNPVDTALDLLLMADGSVGIMHFVIDERDVRTVMRHPAVMIGSDATARSLTGPMSEGKPHPRAFGTFTRVLGRFARDEGVLQLGTAVAKMTGLPARRLALHDRGVLAAGNFADITVFDRSTVLDTATFAVPHSLSAGIEYVLVNGEVVVDNGSLLPIEDRSPGRVLRRGAN